MLFAAISKPESLQSIPAQVDGIELRLDLFPKWDLPMIRQILADSARPIMVTLRKASQGGKFSGSEEEREAKLLQLLDLKPAFIDLEWDMRADFLKEALQKYPQTKCILSYHNFQQTPEDLEALFRSMAVYPAYHYKIAAMALSTNDALRMLLFSRSHPQVSAICMGEKGAFARVLGPIAGNLVNYASLENEQTAPGQLSVSDLVNIYRYPALNADTVPYGLIGDPVAHSRGDLHHNAVFTQRGWNAVYVKMVVKPEELSTFFSLAKQLGFRGLSVTMPLKESILPFIDEIDPKAAQIGAVNTLLFKQGRLLGTNTDGKGALDAIEKKSSVQNKKVVILGAGGAAKAIAFEAKHRGAEVWILNRTLQKAQTLAAAIGCKAGGLSDLPNNYDILINCSPNPMPIDPDKMIPNTVVMDVVYVPRETEILLKAKELGCTLVYGDEMFLNQAAIQTSFWS